MIKVSRITVNENLKKAIKACVDELGGFKKFIKTGDVVFLKPNCNTADPFPASTDFDFIKAMVEIIYEAGAKLVMVGDSSTVSLNTRKVFDQKGFFKLLDEPMPPRLYIFEEGDWVSKVIKGGKYLKRVSLPAILDRPDKLILLPCLKTHKYARYTGALKLAVGFMKPFERVPLHFRNLQEKVAELNTVINPDLIIMDGRKCFITKGPSSGEVREPGLILASVGRTAIDIEGIRIIKSFPGNSLSDVVPEDLPQIKRAMELEIA